MRLLRFLSLFVLFVMFDYVGNIYICLTPSPHPLPPSSSVGHCLYPTKDVSLKRTFIDMVVLHLLMLTLWLIFLQYQYWVHMCSITYYVPFDTNLNLNLFSCLWYSLVLQHILCTLFSRPCHLM